MGVFIKRKKGVKMSTYWSKREANNQFIRENNLDGEKMENCNRIKARTRSLGAGKDSV